MLLVFYNSKNLSCIGALSFLKDLFDHTEIVKGAKNREGLKRDFFKIPLKCSEKLVFEQFGGF